jgi:hypothetical protein
LEAFFTGFATNGLVINLEKCVFTTPTLDILEHKISAMGAAPTADHTAKLKIAHPLRTSNSCNASLAW